MKSICAEIRLSFGGQSVKNLMIGIINIMAANYSYS